MKKIFLICLVLAAAEMSAISELEKLFLKEAVTPEAKKTTKEYFAKRAQDYKDLAVKYEGLSKQPQGGKAASAEGTQKKYKKLSEDSLKEAEKYQAEADKL
ncbi:hypothetical protein EHS15_09465 [Leptospira idonii]|uniref:Uncharacterized protein n=2 Tax=Leptospira idonii TaxID=1193500 RepID=A0A4R9M0Z4_9LEPT|nr:hypothetical protein EHS15_09465 [Leptospira idonii]